jgi:asparagine N-glycosylation enzyme membrane subunit Stt3
MEIFNATHRRQFYEGHRSIALLMIVIVFFSPFAGLYVAALFGAVIGVLCSFAAYYLIPFIWHKIGG